MAPLWSESELKVEVGKWQRRLDTGQIRWSDSMFRLHEQPPCGPVTVESIAQTIHEADREAFTEAFEQALDGSLVQVSYRAILPGGRVRRLVLASHGFGRTDEDIEVIFGVVLDLTEQFSALNEARFESLVSAIPDALALLDEGGRCLATFGAGPGPFGAAQGAPGRHLEELVGERWHSFVEIVHKALASGRVETLDYELEGPRQLVARVSSLGEEQPGLVLWLARDVTAERKLTSRLQHAQKLESLGLMAGRIAHDFNNMMVAVLTNASFARTALDPGSLARDALDDVVQAAQTAAELCQQLLAYSGKGRFEVCPLDLNALIEGLSPLLRVSLPRHVELTKAIATDRLIVEADQAQLKQILLNLVINAGEAMEGRPGQVTLTTRLEEIEAERRAPLHGELLDGPHALLEVSDEGVGMDDRTLDRVFDPFFTTKAEGRGLGLAAILGVVLGHGGALEVDTRPGLGTTFRVLLRVSLDGVSEPRAPKAPGPTRVVGRKILIVDDDSGVRGACRRLLIRAGCEVVTAEDGLQGLEALLQIPDIDLAIVDMTMPVLDGEGVWRQMQAKGISTPVLFSSGFSDKDALGAIVGSGQAGFLAKPYTNDELLGAIEALLPLL